MNPTALAAQRGLRVGSFLKEVLVQLGCLAYFSAAALAMTWPLALHAGSDLGGLGDAVYFAFLIRWFQRAIFVLGADLYHIPWLNYPAGWNLASTDTSFATTFPGIPFAALWGDAAGFNAAMLLTFILSGWAMFAWVRKLSGSAAAGLVAGTIFAFLPYRMAHYRIGHLNLSGTQWFPLYFWGLYDLLRARRWNWRAGLLAGVMLGLIALTSMYYLMMTLLISGVFCLGYVWFAVRPEVASSQSLLATTRFWLGDVWSAVRRGLASPQSLLATTHWRFLLRGALWKNGLLAAGVSLPLVALGTAPFVAFSRSGGLASRSAEALGQYSASPLDYFIPFAAHWLWWPWVAQTYMRERWVEGSLYLGVVSLALAGLAWAKVRAPEQRALLKISALAGAAAFLLSLGVYLTWAGQPVQLPLPGGGQAPIPLPDLFLLGHLPFFNKMRALERFGFFVPFFCALAAGLGAGWLLRGLRPRAALAGTLVIIALVGLDFGVVPQKDFIPLGPRAVDTWLATQPGTGAVAEFPFTRAVDQDLVYYALYHGKPYIGGFFSANVPDQYWLIQPVLAQFPNPESLALLKKLGVAYVLIEERKYPDMRGMLTACEGLGMTMLARLDGVSVWGMR